MHRSSPNRSGQIQRDDNKRRCSAKTAVVSTSKLFQHNCSARVELQRSNKLKFCRAFTTFRIAFTTFVALLLNLESCSYLSAWFFFPFLSPFLNKNKKVEPLLWPLAKNLILKSLGIRIVLNFPRSKNNIKKNKCFNWWRRWRWASNDNVTQKFPAKL